MLSTSNTTIHGCQYRLHSQNIEIIFVYCFDNHVIQWAVAEEVVDMRGGSAGLTQTYFCSLVR